jgi:hypothetical protein
MQRPALALALVLLVASTGGCGLAAFDATVQGSTTVQKGTLLEQVLPMDFSALGGIDLSQTQSFQNRGVKPSQVDSIKLKSLILQITAPASGQDFSFLNSIEFDVGASGQPTRRIAESAPGAFQGTRKVTLNVDDVELKPYATASNFSITTQANANKRPDQDTTIQATVVFHVIPHL